MYDVTLQNCKVLICRGNKYNKKSSALPFKSHSPSSDIFERSVTNQKTSNPTSFIGTRKRCATVVIDEAAAIKEKIANALKSKQDYYFKNNANIYALRTQNNVVLSDNAVAQKIQTGNDVSLFIKSKVKEIQANNVSLYGKSNAGKIYAHGNVSVQDNASVKNIEVDADESKTVCLSGSCKVDNIEFKNQKGKVQFKDFTGKRPEVKNGEIEEL